MSEKRKYKTIVTPKGSALYAYLNKPEVWEGKEVGYTIQLKLNKEDTDALIAMIDEELEQAKQEMELKPGKKWSKEPFLGYREDKEGDIIFKFKASTEIKTKTGETIKRTIPVFDAHRNIMKDVKLGNGSIVKVAFSMMPFWVSNVVNGIALRLSAVQVLDLVEYGGGNAQAFGFGEEEGYDAKEKEKDEFAEENNGEF